MIERNNKWPEYFRFITPIMVTISLFILANINHKVECIDEKLFKHLTNDDMHTPKSMVISKAEFSIYQEFRQKQMDDIKDAIYDIRASMKAKIR